MKQARLKVKVEASLDYRKDQRFEVARFLAYGDAMLYVRAVQANPGMIWALYITSGKVTTPVYTPNADAA